MVTANPGDVYWGTVGLYASLFEGLVNGYNEHVLEVERISHTDFLILQVATHRDKVRQSVTSSTSSQSSVRAP